MNDTDRIKEIIGKHLDVRAGGGPYKRMLDTVLEAHESITTTSTAATPAFAGRFIMKRPMVRFTIAAAIIAAVVLGLFEFINTGSTSGVAWGEVARKVQASRGVIYRDRRGPERPQTDSDRAITYLTPTHYRGDSFLNNQPWIAMYDDRAAGKRVVLLHAQKKYVLEDIKLTREGNRRHADYQDPAWWVQKFVTCKYTKLEPKEIDGTLCEGIETTDLALLEDPESGVNSLVARLWVSVETGYPILFDGEFHGQQKSCTVFDQFQWDVAIDPSIFAPNIPAGYEQM